MSRLRARAFQTDCIMQRVIRQRLPLRAIPSPRPGAGALTPAFRMEERPIMLLRSELLACCLARMARGVALRGRPAIKALNFVLGDMIAHIAALRVFGRLNGLYIVCFF